MATGLIEKAFYELVTDNSELQDLRGSRFYFKRAPSKSAKPYQVFYNLSGNAERFMLGVSRIHTIDFAIESCSGHGMEAAALDLATKNVLISIRGFIGSGADRFEIQRINWVGDPSGFVVHEGKETGVFAYRSRYEVMYYGVGATFD